MPGLPPPPPPTLAEILTKRPVTAGAQAACVDSWSSEYCSKRPTSA